MSRVVRLNPRRTECIYVSQDVVSQDVMAHVHVYKDLSKLSPHAT